MPGIPIANIDCITINGPDARRFAQTQFAGNLDTLEPGHWQWNAWLDAQGRVRLLMHLADIGDGRLLVLPRGGTAEAVRAALARYLLRARATLTTAPLLGCAGGPMPYGAVATGHDETLLGYGERSLRLVAATGVAIDPEAARRWRLADIRLGWPRLPPGESRFLPPALGLHRLGATAFDKGCYPGQEIVARLHYRGGHKRRLYHVRGTAPLPPGQAVETAGGMRIWGLDGVPADNAFEALIVGSENMPIEFNVLQTQFNIISTFDA